ncbi:BapA prefix-like domain-containing protein [Ensifer sp. SL37]|uniref:BapA prefix-like domain-containing protein n=1 Tax=Ensifer sp. SL37 TaxID=2995137 RepID=UPI00227575D7|nr:BapA prefix-like domain-containing protein [Ensifer sp. SL37]MCY1740625.1 BapA prefix-like domain-containing protein [Ensifer sp. SL37]
MYINAEVMPAGSDKAKKVVLQGSSAKIDVGHMSDVAFCLSKDAVAAFERRGEDLILRLANGETIRLVNFFREDEDGRPKLFLTEKKESDDAEGAMTETG